MSYKILLPVTALPELVKAKIDAVPDLSRLILVNNYDNPEVDVLCRDAHARGAEVYHCPWNQGVAASWNIGMRRTMEDGDDFCVILSASCIFDVPFQKIVDAVVEREVAGKNGRYLFDRPTATGHATHCFVMTRLGIEVGGYFDENYFPVYYEDTDYCTRGGRNGLAAINIMLGHLEYMHSVGYSQAVAKDPRLMSLYQHNVDRFHKYYLRKWGGDHTFERFDRPFNDPSKGVNDWTIEGPFNNLLVGNSNWMPPDWRGCRL